MSSILKYKRSVITYVYDVDVKTESNFYTDPVELQQRKLNREVSFN